MSALEKDLTHGSQAVRRLPVEDPSAGDFERRIGAPVSHLYALVADLAHARPDIYWTDLLASCAVAYGGFLMANSVLDFWLEGLLLAVSAAAAYRASLFTHELVHLPRARIRGFYSAWNLLCGVPMLVPSFLYEIHSIHHDRRSYGTAADGEYRPFASTPLGEAVASVAATPLAVPALVARFLVLAPLGWLMPAVRRRVLSRASALVIDFRAVRPLPSKLPVHWLVQEAGCFGYCLCMLVLVVRGDLSVEVLWRGYIVITLAIFANSLRVLCAHRYRSQGVPMSLADQVLDSNNFPRGLAGLWAPLGLRFHAIHHLFPGLPYHALGEAHRRLMRAVPADSELRGTRRDSFVAGVRDVFQSRRPAMRAAHEG